MSKTPASFKFSDATLAMLEALASERGTDKTESVEAAIREMHGASHPPAVVAWLEVAKSRVADFDHPHCVSCENPIARNAPRFVAVLSDGTVTGVHCDSCATCE